MFKCKMCGGDLDVAAEASVGVCQFCGTQQTLPRLDNDRRANLYDRANHFRRNNEYDKAMSIYETILSEDGTDAEAYWSLVLCKYGIEYVEDPATRRRISTCNRTQLTSIFADENYKQAIAHADGLARDVYEAEAKAIDAIQKSILEISSKEAPFDVFICYKETDAGGRRTPDSVLAQDLYHQLIQEGFKVFFSRITLEDKLGSAYEPYIFAALQSAKVMVVLGTRTEHFNAVWVKNEWSRYLGLIKSGAKKTLIPAYRDMDPYDLPEEFSHLQAQDMGKLGFMQDLLRGIRKLLNANVVAAQPVGQTSSPGNTAALLQRAFLTIEDGDWAKADALLEKVLNAEPTNAKAYIGKLMIECKIRQEENLPDCGDHTFTDSLNYNKALRFADDTYRVTLQTYERERIYRKAVRSQANANSSQLYFSLVKGYGTIPGYKDADSRAAVCKAKAEELSIAEQNERERQARLAEQQRLAQRQREEQRRREAQEQIAILQQQLAPLQRQFAVEETKVAKVKKPKYVRLHWLVGVLFFFATNLVVSQLFTLVLRPLAFNAGGTNPLAGLYIAQSIGGIVIGIIVPILISKHLKKKAKAYSERTLKRDALQQQISVVQNKIDQLSKV